MVGPTGGCGVHGSGRTPTAARILIFNCYIEILVVGFSRLLVVGAQAVRSAAANDVKGDHCEQHAKSAGVAALASPGHPASQRFRVARGCGANDPGRRVSGPKTVSVG